MSISWNGTVSVFNILKDIFIDLRSHLTTIFTFNHTFFHLNCVHLLRVLFERIKGFLSREDTEKLVHAFIFSKLDYYNGVFTGLKSSLKTILFTAAFS